MRNGNVGSPLIKKDRTTHLACGEERLVEGHILQDLRDVDGVETDAETQFGVAVRLERHILLDKLLGEVQPVLVPLREERWM